MYGFVPYNLSPIQQGIQFGHAVVEYMLKYHGEEDLVKWAKVDKTFIILNGGTFNDKTNDEGEYLGSMNRHRETLAANNIKHASFNEPDLQDGLSAIVFLVDERVFDRDTYVLPEYPSPPGHYMVSPPSPMPIPQQYIDNYNIQVMNILGSAENIFLREFVKPFRLA